VKRKPAGVLCRNLDAILEKLIEIITSTNKDYAEHTGEVFSAFVHIVATVMTQAKQAGRSQYVAVFNCARKVHI